MYGEKSMMTYDNPYNSDAQGFCVFGPRTLSILYPRHKRCLTVQGVAEISSASTNSEKPSFCSH